MEIAIRDVVMGSYQESEQGRSLEHDEIVLQRTLDQLVRFGLRVGVGPENMISLLESGVNESSDKCIGMGPKRHFSSSSRFISATRASSFSGSRSTAA